MAIDTPANQVREPTVAECGMHQKSMCGWCGQTINVHDLISNLCQSCNPSSSPSPQLVTDMKVLFLSSDTGGGHRASAESLGKQFQLHYPGSTYQLLDIMSDHGVPPYNSLVQSYKHLSAHPMQWKTVYNFSNNRAFEVMSDVHLKVMCEKAIRKRIQSYKPDVVISVHPLMNNLPAMCCQKISQKTGKHLPFFTVVTDLGSAHGLWFTGGVEKTFVASEQIRHVAKNTGRVTDDRLAIVGLPIRHDFAVHAKLLGDRMSESGKKYQRKVRQDLGLGQLDSKIVLVMGGGEGVGSLSKIVNALFIELTRKCIHATILVVCGRNDKLKTELEEKDWDKVINSNVESRYLWKEVAFKISSFMNTPLQDDLITDVDTGPPSLAELSDDGYDSDFPSSSLSHTVQVKALGFITKMAEYMVSADVLVSKAGPGTIAEAASVGLPVMITSFLPGQEEGNVDFVVDGGFGAFRPDHDPESVAIEVGDWLVNNEILAKMSRSAFAAGKPNAASEIVRFIGESTLRWRELNGTGIYEF